MERTTCCSAADVVAQKTARLALVGAATTAGAPAGEVAPALLAAPAAELTVAGADAEVAFAAVADELSSEEAAAAEAPADGVEPGGDGGATVMAGDGAATAAAPPADVVGKDPTGVPQPGWRAVKM